MLTYAQLNYWDGLYDAVRVLQQICISLESLHGAVDCVHIELGHNRLLRRVGACRFLDKLEVSGMLGDRNQITLCVLHIDAKEAGIHAVLAA